MDDFKVALPLVDVKTGIVEEYYVKLYLKLVNISVYLKLSSLENIGGLIYIKNQIYLYCESYKL